MFSTEVRNWTLRTSSFACDCPQAHGQARRQFFAAAARQHFDETDVRLLIEDDDQQPVFADEAGVDALVDALLRMLRKSCSPKISATWREDENAPASSAPSGTRSRWLSSPCDEMSCPLLSAGQPGPRRYQHPGERGANAPRREYRGRLRRPPARLGAARGGRRAGWATGSGRSAGSPRTTSRGTRTTTSCARASTRRSAAWVLVRLVHRPRSTTAATGSRSSSEPPA